VKQGDRRNEEFLVAISIGYALAKIHPGQENGLPLADSVNRKIVAAIRRGSFVIGLRPQARLLICVPNQRTIAGSGVIRVKPFSGNRSDTVAAISRMTPAEPNAIQWVPKVS
jgi:hypothetical protein